MSRLAPAALFGLLIALFVNYRADLAPEWGKWYSGDAAYRLQTEAFLRGELAIESRPALRNDWAWGNGVQQVWGLGVPALRLPFELGARALGYKAFPDRAVLLGLYAVVGALLVTAFVRPRRDLGATGFFAWPFAGLLAFAVLTEPVLMSLLRTRFEVYEEAVAFNCLWAALVGALLVISIRRGSVLLLTGTALIAGFAPVIRPTGAAYLGAACIVAAGAAFRLRGLPALLAVLFSSAIFPALLAFTNFLRFGHALEFGHRLNYTDPLNGYLLNFDSPASFASFWDASRELFSALFLLSWLNAREFFAADFFPWQMPILRFREFYFSPFGPRGCILLLGSWAITALLWSLRKRCSIGISGETRALFAYSLVSFAALFLGYLYSPSLSSRYLADFSPAVAFAAAGAVLAVRDAGSNLGRMGRALSGVFLIEVLFFQFLASAEAKNRYRRPYPNAIRYAAAAEREAPLPPLASVPKRLACPDDTKTEGISSETGWNRDTCAVEPFTSLFLPHSSCVRLTARFPFGSSGPELGAVRVKVHLEYFELRRTAPHEDGTTTLEFCAAKPFSGNGRIELVHIAWVPLEALTPELRTGIELHEASAEGDPPVT